MTVLSDLEIISLCSSGAIEDWSEDLINPASLDVRLGSGLMIEVAGQKDLLHVDISSRTEKNPYRLTPGEFVLAETHETFKKIPDHICAQFALKSSRAREGYENLLAGWIDPGFCNSKLTLELVNVRRHYDLPLYPGLKIGQIIFMRMSEVPLKSYSKTGRYNGDVGVQGSKG
jgi:dCTP deaminase